MGNFACRRIVGELLLADGETHTTAAEYTAFVRAFVMAFRAGVGGRCDCDVVLGDQCSARIRDDVAAYHRDVLALHPYGATAEGAGYRRGFLHAIARGSGR
ncbi:hypothetical protein FQZ97_615480 [compost metagenome]